MKINAWKLILAIVICQLAGIIGSLFIVSAIPAWYSTLAKPWFTPPNWVFGLVWIALYALMGIAVYLVYEQKVKNKKLKNFALTLFAVQLILNALWSIVFFGMQSLFGGLLIIVLLWLALAVTMVKFYEINKIAYVLLVPYLLWLSLATALNYWVWVLN